MIWTEDPNRPLPIPKQRGRSRQYPPLETLPRPQNLRALAGQLPASAWRTVAWRPGSRGMQRSRFAMIPIWAAHGWRKQQHPARVVEWLLVEWPKQSKEPTKYWLARRPASGGEAAGAHRQGSLAGGVGLPRIETRTGTGSLRGPSVAGLAPSRLPGQFRLCVPSL